MPGFTGDFNEDFFASDGLIRLQHYLDDKKVHLVEVPPEVRIGCPIARPSKIVAVGLNYLTHIKATGLPFPQEPVLFLKSNLALCGPNDNILLPPGSQRTDWETELAVIIKKRAS